MNQDSSDQCWCCDPVKGGIPACPQCRSSNRVTMTITQDMWEIQCLNCDIYFDGETGSQIFDVLDEPAGLKPTSRTATTISLEWSAVDRAKAYKLRYQKYDADEWILCAAVNTTAVTVVNLEPGEGYNFQVKSLGDRLSSSDWSNSTIESTRRR